MTLSGVLPTTEYAPDARYRARDRRAPQDRFAKAEAGAASAPAETAPDGFDAAFFSSRFKADLTQLKAFDGAGDETAAPGGEVDSGLADFFGNLSVLLVAVRAGDIARAQSAADALELDALVEANAPKRPGASAPLLDDLVALLSAAQLRDESAARLAALDLATDFQSARAPVAFAPRDAYAEEEPDDDDVGAAYDTLSHFNDGEPGVA